MFDIEVTGELNISQIFKGNHFKIRLTVMIVKNFREPKPFLTVTDRVTHGTKLIEMIKGRNYSFQLRDFAGRTVLAANCQTDMDQCIFRLKEHKRHLKQ